MSIERNFDVPFIAKLALHEKQIQQNYRPIIAVHKWFARRPGTLFRGLLLAEFGEGSVRENFYRANRFPGKRVADPFMGGGTPLLEANRLSCDVVGYDINPMAFWIVRQELEYLDLKRYSKAAASLVSSLRKQVGDLYLTRCLFCNSEDASVKYFLWVKQGQCPRCGKQVDLSPGYLVAQDRRHPRNVFVCPTCGDLTETKSRKRPAACCSCKSVIPLGAPSARGQRNCPYCGESFSFPRPEEGPPRHRMFAMEYHCAQCRPTHEGRFFKKPDQNDIGRYDLARARLQRLKARFIPTEEIPPGDETSRLHRWGYLHYREMFNERQLLGLETSARLISEVSDESVRDALATNLSDLLRYQNMLCRYDTMALKSLDIFSIHGFPVGLIQCESNLLGIPNGGGTNVGSGGWSNIVDKFRRAKSYCARPFEMRHEGGRQIPVLIPDEWIGAKRNSEGPAEARGVDLRCASATAAKIPPASLDAVMTDPPYFSNVQYAELMDFCYVWLRKLVGAGRKEFQPASTRNEVELTGNATMERGLVHFTEGLATAFCRMASALKPGAPFAFTYHHNQLEAYFPLAVAILDAGLTCSAAIPCPAEMGGSVHISGTSSSVVDTVFICRSTGKVSKASLADSPPEIAAIVVKDLRNLEEAGLTPTQGDIRCVLIGHLIRLAIWKRRSEWDQSKSTTERLRRISTATADLGGVEAVENIVIDLTGKAPSVRGPLFREEPQPYGTELDEVSF
jgi:adenine-specific DNA methylase